MIQYQARDTGQWQYVLGSGLSNTEIHTYTCMLTHKRDTHMHRRDTHRHTYTLFGIDQIEQYHNRTLLNH